MVELLKAVLWGIVEGITEWLPISSTGHMILLDELIRLNVSESFKEMFLVVIQLGAIMAVVLLYFHKLNPFSPRKSKQSRKETINLWCKVIVGVLPAAILGFLFDDWLDEYLYNYVTVAITLVLYGILFIVVENRNKHRITKVREMNELSFRTAFLIGMFQVLALIPGNSRSVDNILVCILLWASRSISADFSFFLSIHVMFCDSALKLVKFGFNFTGMEIAILIVGMIVAFLVSVAAIKFLLGYIKKNDFKAFGWYRIGLGIIVLVYFLVSH